MQTEQEPTLPQLTPNGVRSLLNEQKKGHVFQILDAELLNSPIGSKKFKCFISDGNAKHKAVIANDAALVFESKQAPTNCIIRADDVMVHKDQKTNRKIVMILKMTILVSDSANVVIGQPADYDEKMEVESEDVKVNSYVSELESECISLDLLRPYTNFFVKVRVTSKTPMKAGFKEGRSTKVFSVDLMDKDGNELTATFFGDVAELYYQIIEQNSVYLMRNGEVRRTNPKYNKNNTLYQIIFENNNLFVMKVENESDIPLRFSFTKINKVYQINNNTEVDVVGFVNDKIFYPGHNGADIQIYDDTNTPIRVKMGNIDIQQVKDGQLVVFKSAKVGFSDGQKCLLSVKGTRFFHNSRTMPVNCDLNRLIEWKQKEFRVENLPKLQINSQVEYIPCKIEEMKNLLAEKGIAKVLVIAHISFIKNSEQYYDENADEYGRRGVRGVENCDLCGIKLLYQGQNVFGCESCGKSVQGTTTTYRRSVKLKDDTGEIWLQVPDSFLSAVSRISEADLMAIQELDDLFETINRDVTERVFLMSVDYNGNEYFVKSCEVQQVAFQEINRDMIGMLEGYRNASS